MDRAVVAGGTVAAAAALTVALLESGTPEAVGLALFLAGAVVGAASRSFQSEFLDAYASGALGFALAVTAVAWVFDGVSAANAFYGAPYNLGLLPWLAGVAFSPVPALVAGAGGEVGARFRYRVTDWVAGE
jgi:hypothetical protein